VTKIVKGKENLTLETIYKLSKALDVELISFPEYAYTESLATAAFAAEKR
jgi:transcriptional regulator with XRE-family HTH domain